MKRLPTLLIGIVGGIVVGLTSVGSGSLMIVLLLMLYPRLKLSELVGTDLVQAVPLVTSAAIGHLLFGDFNLGLTSSILIGSVPGVFLGAHFSSRAPDHVIRPSLIVVLSAWPSSCSAWATARCWCSCLCPSRSGWLTRFAPGAD